MKQVRRNRLVLALLSALSAQAAMAQDAPPPAQKQAPATLDTIVITGTRANDRTVA